MYWQRPHMEGSQFEFIPQGSECNGDVTRRRHGAADRGGTVRGNAIHTICPVRDEIIWRYDRELLGAPLR